MKARKLIITTLILLALLLPAGTAYADAGPKPTMEFTFEYETDEPLTIVDGVLIQCEDPECLEGHELEHLGPQDFTCTETTCSSMAYGYAGDNILVITFSDGVTRMSNQFGKQHFNANYTVTVYENELVVVETGGSVNPIITILVAVCAVGILGLGLVVSLIVLIVRGGRDESLMESSRRWIIFLWVLGGVSFIASVVATFYDLSFLGLAVTLAIEGILISAYYIYRKQPWQVPFTLNLSGNLLTQMALWYVLVGQATGDESWIVLLLTEAVIVLIEAVILFWPQRKQISFLQALSLSFVLNLISFTIGLFLPI